MAFGDQGACDVGRRLTSRSQASRGTRFLVELAFATYLEGAGAFDSSMTVPPPVAEGRASAVQAGSSACERHHGRRPVTSLISTS